MPLQSKALSDLEKKFQTKFWELSLLETKIHEEIKEHADEKVLKGNERVGWLGEIYGKTLYGGKLVDDTHEHDFVANNGRMRVSVKTRKGRKKGWQKSGIVRSIDGEKTPTHFMFVHLNDNYSVDRIWNFPWTYLMQNGRLREKVVRNQMLGWQISIRDTLDGDYLIIDNRSPITKASKILKNGNKFRKATIGK